LEFVLALMPGAGLPLVVRKAGLMLGDLSKVAETGFYGEKERPAGSTIHKGGDNGTETWGHVGKIKDD